ncbi:NnrS family protein [Herminiimonas sp. CN]|uniref:NnrS family protein n=1 Tax=Herminiimonas sp. CN TaxID=1349818 RepID=UPI001EE662EA|nr:NnrS family protein [Herminiimonas sp. CN]
MTIDEPNVSRQGKPSPTHHPLWALGFRPFYLLAAAFAAVSIPLWLASYFGHLSGLANITINWHMHEMVFGFAVAVIIGFLFTAGRNWTGLWTPRRGYLAALVGVWLAGRIAMLAAPALIAALVDLLFLPLAAWPMYRVLQRSGNKRNMFLIGLLSLLTIVNLLFHLAAIGWISTPAKLIMQAAILIVVMIESVMGGRIIPGFTSNTVPGTKPVVNPQRDRLTIAFTAMASLAWIFTFPPRLIAALAFAAACSQLFRLGGWKPHATLRHPLLWILHLSYAWIPCGFILIALAALQVVSTSSAFHVLTIGSMAGLIVGMMTRTTLGHTGRPLKASGNEMVMYALIQIGVIARFCASIDSTGLRNGALIVAAASWSAAFVLFLIVYGPYLYRPRLDGKEG